MNRFLAAGRDVCAGRSIWPAAFGAGLTAVLTVPAPASSQTLSDVQRDLKQMKQQYESELRRMKQDYDARLRRLESRLKAAESRPPAPAKATVARRRGAGCRDRHGPSGSCRSRCPTDNASGSGPPGSDSEPWDRVHDRDAAR